METKKVLGIIFSILFIGAFTFCLTWGIINFNKVKQGMSGTGIYTQEDLNKSYEDGYNTALKNKEEYDQLIAGYRDNITTLNDTISQLNSQVTTLTNNNRDYKTQVTNLTNIKTQNETTIANLQSTITTNNGTISSLNTQISNLQTQISNLQADGEYNEQEIARLNNQIITLQNLALQLQTTNDLNITTINTLNNQIVSLNNQISELNLQMQNNNSQVGSLTNRISELEQSVTYYEQYIASLENGEQVVATFEFNGSVYNIQILNKNSIASVVNPTSTDYVIFNGWTVNGQAVDLSTYEVTTNTKFVADVTYRYNVNFVVDGTTVNSQIVTKNAYATLPTAPTKTGYEFDGWSIDGVNVVNVSTSGIIANTTYTAVFTKLYNVTFMYEDTVVSTQTIRNGNYATAPLIENTAYKVFNGWKLNNAITDVANYKITGAVIFIADIIYKYDVNFVVDGTTVNSQIVTKNGYAIVPTAPTKTGYEFDGWSIDGTNFVNVATHSITVNTTYTAIFTKLYNVTFMYEDTVVSTQTIRNGNYATAPLIENTAYKVFNGWKLNNVITDISSYAILDNITFIADITYKYDVSFVANGTTVNSQIVTKNGYAIVPTAPTKTGYEFDGWSIDGENVIDVLSNKITQDTQYVSVFSRECFAVKEFNDITDFSVSNIWTDGENTYYSDGTDYQYVLDKETSIWIPKTWNLSSMDLVIFKGPRIWTDGENIYCTLISNRHYVLDKTTSTWVSKTWSGIGINVSLNASTIWSDGENIYYSNGQSSNKLVNYVLNKETSTWSQTSWKFGSSNIGFSFYASDIWTDGENIYCSKGTSQYVLNKGTSKWETKTWNGLTDFSASNVWTVGDNIYCSIGTSQYVLDKETSTWVIKTWNGLTDFYGSTIWTDGNNIYCFNGSTHYILTREIAN